jgi:hypothetical protein
MSVFACAIIAALAFGDEPSPAELVQRLSSADRVEREEAARTLEELGVAALPALHVAEKAGPGAARSKAGSLARLIEGRLLERPSKVAVDFDGQPLEEAIRTLAARSGYTIQLDAGDGAAPGRRPVVARVPASVSFWEALDMIGRAGHVRHDPGAAFRDTTRVPVLHLVEGEPPSRTLYRGPFRVHLVGLHHRRDLDLGGSPGRAPSSVGVLYVDLQAFAEPGRFLDFDGLPRLEATDDHGRPLPAAPPDAKRPGLPAAPAWEAPGAIGFFQWRLPLGMPDTQAVKQLRSLRGSLPVIVSATRPEPLVISLDDAPGKSYRHGETTLGLRILQNSARQMEIEVILTQDPDSTASRDDPAQGPLRRRFGFEGPDGQPLYWLPSPENAGPGKETRIRMIIAAGKRPVRLRFHGLTWNRAEIPFEFADVPLP